MTLISRHAPTVTAIALFLTFTGCAQATTLGGDADGGGNGDAASGGDGSTRNDGGTASDGSTTDGGITSGDGGGPSAEVCDGIDNDGNGIADDVDVGLDGVCDCLSIATLGLAGEWGEGNVFAAWLDARSDTGATDLGDAVLTNALLAPFQVIVVQDIRGRTYSGAEVDALEAWVQAGGGLMTLIGYGDPDERTNVNRLLEPSGIQYDSAQILHGQPLSLPITMWETHPVSDMITQVGIDNGYEVTGGGTVLAREMGYDVLRVTTLGSGHVLVWGDEWITYDSEWEGRPEFQVERFWLNAIKWLTPAAECQVPILF